MEAGIFTSDSFSVYGVVQRTKITQKVLAADGNTYEINVTYGQDAAIPADAELIVTELLPGEERYDEYLRKAVLAEKQDPRAFAEQFCAEHPDAVVTANEVGAGVVPMAAEDRAFREAVGRALCVIAGKAEQVTRCTCGIGVRIK